MIELTNDFRVALPVEQAWAVLTDIERVAPCMPGAQLLEIEGGEFRGIVKVKVGPITAQYKGVASFVEKDDAGHRAVVRGEGRDTRGQGNANATITVTLLADGPAATSVTIHTDLSVSGKVAQFGRGVMADVSTKLIGQFVACLEREVLAAGTPPAADPAVDPGPAPAVEPDVGTEKGLNAGSPMGAGAGATVESGAQPTPEGSAGGAAVAAAPTATAADDTGAQTVAATAAAPVTAPAGPRRVESRPVPPVDLLDAAGGQVAKRVAPVVAALVVVLLLWRWRRRRR